MADSDDEDQADRATISKQDRTTRENEAELDDGAENKDTGRSAIGYFDQFKPEEIKKEKYRLLQIGQDLQNKVKALKRTYFYEDIAFDAVREGSKIINKCEANFGKYLSYLRIDVRVYNRYSKTRKRKTDCMDTLSKVTTVWLQRFAPHIVEITSYNRAKQVATLLVRLYQHERQDMFTSARRKYVPSVTDKNILECIKQTLKFCYDRCHDLAYRQSLKILEHLTLSTKYNITNCPSAVRLLVRELQKQSVSFTLPYIQKMMRQSILSELSLRLIVKHHHTEKPPLRTFIDLCTEVTWFMQFQDPPIALDFEKDGGKEKFAPFEHDGDVVEFVVWPAMLLHENGMTVALGVAEYQV